MDCVELYKCLGDETRLRILNLLMEGPLCVCHVQVALEEPQAKASKQLAYMKRLGLLVSRRKFNWTIYEIATDPNPLRDESLASLKALVFSSENFAKDRERLKEVDTSIACEPQSSNFGVRKKMPSSVAAAKASE